MYYIKKVAVVTDDKVLAFLPTIAKHFVNAEVENFDYKDRIKAIDWIIHPKIKEHGITVGINQIQNTFYVKMDIKGILTHQDYETMIPIIEDTIKSVPHPKLKVLVNALELDGWEMQAAWDDLKFGFKHNIKFEKIAYVGSKTWEEYGIKISNWFVSGEMKYFTEELSAKQWLLD